MAARKLVSEQTLGAALIKHGGIKSEAAKECGIRRQTVQERVENSPFLQAQIKIAKEEWLDLGESVIHKAMKRGDKDMTRLYVTQQGASRGYGNKIEASIRLSETDIQALVAAFGGDINAMRAFHASLVSPGTASPAASDPGNNPKSR